MKSLIDPKCLRFSLIPRNTNADKSNFGHVFILAGSPGMTGAACLAGEACLKSGAGLVTLGVPKGLQNIYAKKQIPELMCLGLPESRKKTLGAQAYSKIISFIRARNVNCLAVGPGLSHEAGTAKLIQKIVRCSPVPVVLDADGLNCFKGHAEKLIKRQVPLVLTPHRREFERLFALPWPQAESQRAMLAKKLCRFYDVVLVLKGRCTLVADRHRVYRNLTGNPGMAKGGSGDVLTGIIAAFIAQGLDLFYAAVWAVYFHGKAGDAAVREKGELSLMPSDLIHALPRILKTAGVVRRGR
jgi:NAD(P)H-hydrate epimerase